MRQTLRYMTWPFIITGIGLLLAAVFGPVELTVSATAQARVGPPGDNPAPPNP